MAPQGWLQRSSVTPDDNLIARDARRLCFEEQPMIADSDNHATVNLSTQPAGDEAWHLWTVIFPLRSITGRLVIWKSLAPR